MVLYNVTVNIEKEVEDDWIRYMKKKHIPDVMNTGLFWNFKFYRILSENEDSGPSYCIQYFLNNMDDYHKYQKEEASQLQREHNEKFEGKFTAHRTVMEEI